MHPDYHGASDHWDKVDYANMAKVDRMVARGLLMIADNPVEPMWNEANPKAARYLKAWKAAAPAEGWRKNQCVILPSRVAAVSYSRPRTEPLIPGVSSTRPQPPIRAMASEFVGLLIVERGTWLVVLQVSGYFHPMRLAPTLQRTDETPRRRRDGVLA